MQAERDLGYLDKMIADLGGAASGNAGGPRGGLLEHLRAARRYILGSMPAEYGLSLQEAKASVACISDKKDRAKVKEMLGLLMEPVIASS